MALRYPVVLVHGIILKDVLHFRAFGRIASVLRREGHTVYTSDHDGFGIIENNAEQIKKYVGGVLEKTGAEKVNIIAHSKGGLDTLYMIDRLGMAEKVASVTFLCTPHKGSVIATKLYSLPKFIRGFIAFWINFWYKIFGDKKPDALGVCRELRLAPEGVVECFDHHDGVYMQSYSTELERGKDDFVMGIPLLFSRRFEGIASDGLVSVESSKFREYKGNCVDGSVSHTQIVDFMVGRKRKEKIFEFYRELCENLSKNGF